MAQKNDMSPTQMPIGVTVLPLTEKLMPHAAGCASFVSSTLKSLTAATEAIQIDMAFGASIADEIRRADLQAFATATGQ